MFLVKLSLNTLKPKNVQNTFVIRFLKTNRYLNQNHTIKKSSKAMENEEHLLKIPQGLIKGLKRKTIYNDNYFGFEGIPYAQPPVGDFRFKAPLTAGNWTDVKDCRDSNIKPLQKNHKGQIEGSENCLYLNVYSKRLASEEKLPVMIWIYGGAFNTGSCIRQKYGPDYFMQENVVIVTFNYRLGALGFLSLEDPKCEVPGNAGLKDQELALKWVKSNISYFGGDENNITLFGESAGASSVHFMLTTPQTKGLFHKAICMSGCVLNNWAFNENSTKLSYLLACDKGYKGPNEDKIILEYLQRLPGEQLVQLVNLNSEAAKNGGFCAFIPSLESYDHDDFVIRKPLKELLKYSWGNDIPVIIGGTSFEGLVRYSQLKNNPQLIDMYNENPAMFLPQEVQQMHKKDIQNLLIQQLKDIHFNNAEDLMALMDYTSFFSFWHGLHRFIKSRQLYTSASTYQYLFDFDSPTFNHHRKMFCGDDIITGVAHADDLSYIWYSFYSWKLDKDSKEYLTIQRMVKMFTNFAKTSNPNCEYTMDCPWKTVGESDIQQWLRISDDLKFEQMPEEFRHKLNIWNSLYGKQLL